MSSQVFELKQGALRLALRPDLGASVAGLWHSGTPVLRSMEPDALTGPRLSACFALLPYSNRLGFRRFHWQGRQYSTGANFADSPHSLHGVGWLRPWQVQECGTARVLLHYRHAPDAHWPFAFAAYQRIELTAQALMLRLCLRNTDARMQPVGLGWHPYFPQRKHSRLHMALTACWACDAQQLPTHSAPVAGIDARVATLHYDHCFSGWNGRAVIEDECLRLRLTSSLRHAVVFTPPGRDFFCVEPVSHVSNAIHFDDPTAHGLTALTPGASCAAAMRLHIKALA